MGKPRLPVGLCLLLILGSEGLQAQRPDTFVITGLETGSASGIQRFKDVAARQFGMQALEFALPPEYLKGYIHDEAIIRYVITHQATFPARYLVICFSDPAYCRFMLFDTVVPRRLLESAETRAVQGGFSVPELEKSIRELLEKR